MPNSLYVLFFDKRNSIDIVYFPFYIEIGCLTSLLNFRVDNFKVSVIALEFQGNTN